MADISGEESPLHIFLRNLIRDRTCGSIEELERIGGSAGIQKKLGVDRHTGLATSDVARRRSEYGDNAPPPVKMQTYFDFMWEAFCDFTVILLSIAALIKLVIAAVYEKTAGSYAEAGAILISVLIVTNVTAINDYQKQAQFFRLNATLDDTSVRCKRDGEITDVRSAELVVGDIVQLAIGDIFPADGILLTGHSVATDESALTGEPKLIYKDPVSAPYLLSGTKVMEGSGLFMVLAVGPNSEAGQIRELIRNADHKVDSSGVTTSTEPEKSILTTKLDKIALFLGYTASVLASVALIVMCVSHSILTFVKTDPDYVCAYISDDVCGSSAVNDYATDPSVGFPLCGPTNTQFPCCFNTSTGGAELLGSPCGWLKNQPSEYIGFFVTAITILVVTIPEGLPLAVTLALAYSVKKMQSENNLVKHLDACETMGSTTTICSDKTGTLTKNRMTVVKSSIGDPSLGIDLREHPDSIPELIKDMLISGICLSGSSDITWDPSVKLWDQIGSKTECALLGAVQETFGVFYKHIRTTQGDQVVKRFPFSSAAKKSSFVMKHGDNLRIFTIGASEIVLEQCTSYIVETPVDATHVTTSLMVRPVRVLLEKTIHEFASSAMRTVVLAYKDVPGSINLDSITGDEPSMVYVGLFGIEDPLRDEVPEAIRKCNKAGVQVKMVTGDNLNTAIAIARNSNIIRKEDMNPSTGKPLPYVAMTGPDFRKRVLDRDGNIIQSELDKIWPFLKVLARSSPTDKYTLVSGMIDSKMVIPGQKDRQVVAVTGDGTNDAPALKKADVGFAMGITGTAVARDAADIILLDDNFASIVVACKWGRNVHDSVAKFIQFQFTVSIVALTMALEGAFIYNESPLEAVQMLWVNLIMNSMASLTLATEPPTDALLNRYPHGRSSSVISKIMRWNIGGHVVFQLIILNLIYFKGSEWMDIPWGVGLGNDAPPSEHTTMIFNTLVMMTLTNQINSRRLYHELNVFSGILSNTYFLAILGLETLLQVLFVQFGGLWVKTARLPLWMWGISIGLALCSFPVQWVIIGLRKLYIKYYPDRKRVRASREEIELAAIQAAAEATGDGPSQITIKHRASFIAPLDGDATRHQGAADMELGGGSRLGALEDSQSVGQLDRISHENSFAEGVPHRRSQSERTFKDIIGTSKSVGDIPRRKHGFTNPKRQVALNETFKNLFSSSSSKEEFLEAAKRYYEENSKKK
jgi:P-type Ca2+ transporter type 2B